MTQGIPTIEETATKIKTQGYWEIIIRPLKFEEKRLKTLKACSDLVLENKVRFRGWDYPHVNSKYGVASGESWVENVTDWDEHKEFWRMYQSGQFYNVFGCWEDWWGPVQIFWSEKKQTEPRYGLEFLSTLYSLTEIYEFASRLAEKHLFDEMLNISITLHGMRNRRIVTTEIRRSLFDIFLCRIENIALNKEVSVNELITSNNEMAIDATCYIFERFSWLEPPRRVLKEEQDKFLKGLY